jgi:polysaccharide deacetylase 2 family uncharacterized protein YibQ
VRARFARSWFAALTAAITLSAADAAPRAQIAIIIDDLGEQHAAGLRAIDLPGAVAVAFLPGARFTAAQAGLAHRRGKEVLLHLPLQPEGAARAHPTALRADADPGQLSAFFAAALESVPHAAGVNNHQGSLLTQLAEPMDRLMREVALRPGLYFVDSRTSGASVAYRAARNRGVPSAERNVFLDAHRGEAHVRAALEDLVVRALRDERALAIGHPYPETLKVLGEELPKLARYGVRLVPPSELIARQSGTRRHPSLRLSPALTLATSTTLPAAPGPTSTAAH